MDRGGAPNKGWILREALAHLRNPDSASDFHGERTDVVQTVTKLREAILFDGVHYARSRLTKDTVAQLDADVNNCGVTFSNLHQHSITVDKLKVVADTYRKPPEILIVIQSLTPHRGRVNRPGDLSKESLRAADEDSELSQLLQNIREQRAAASVHPPKFSIATVANQSKREPQHAAMEPPRSVLDAVRLATQSHGTSGRPLQASPKYPVPGRVTPYTLRRSAAAIEANKQIAKERAVDSDSTGETRREHDRNSSPRSSARKATDNELEKFRTQVALTAEVHGPPSSAEAHLSPEPEQGAVALDKAADSVHGAENTNIRERNPLSSSQQDPYNIMQNEAPLSMSSSTETLETPRRASSQVRANEETSRVVDAAEGDLPLQKESTDKAPSTQPAKETLGVPSTGLSSTHKRVVVSPNGTREGARRSGRSRSARNGPHRKEREVEQSHAGRGVKDTEEHAAQDDNEQDKSFPKAAPAQSGATKEDVTAAGTASSKPNSADALDQHESSQPQSRIRAERTASAAPRKSASSAPEGDAPTRAKSSTATAGEATSRENAFGAAALDVPARRTRGALLQTQRELSDSDEENDAARPSEIPRSQLSAQQEPIGSGNSLPTPSDESVAIPPEASDGDGAPQTPASIRERLVGSDMSPDGKTADAKPPAPDIGPSATPEESDPSAPTGEEPSPEFLAQPAVDPSDAPGPREANPTDRSANDDSRRRLREPEKSGKRVATSGQTAAITSNSLPSDASPSQANGQAPRPETGENADVEMKPAVGSQSSPRTVPRPGAGGVEVNSRRFWVITRASYLCERYEPAARILPPKLRSRLDEYRDIFADIRTIDAHGLSTALGKRRHVDSDPLDGPIQVAVQNGADEPEHRDKPERSKARKKRKQRPNLV